MYAKSPASPDAILLSLEEARRALGLGRSTFQKLLKEGHLPVVRLSERVVRVPREALDEFILAREGKWSDK